MGLGPPIIPCDSSSLTTSIKTQRESRVPDLGLEHTLWGARLGPLHCQEEGWLPSGPYPQSEGSASHLSLARAPSGPLSPPAPVPGWAWRELLQLGAHRDRPCRCGVCLGCCQRLDAASGWQLGTLRVLGSRLPLAGGDILSRGSRQLLVSCSLPQSITLTSGPSRGSRG